MAKLYTQVRNERGVEKHQIGDRQVCADFFYGSKEESIKAITVCATVESDPTRKTGAPEKVSVSTLFLSPGGYPIHFHSEEYPLRRRKLITPLL